MQEQFVRVHFVTNYLIHKLFRQPNKPFSDTWCGREITPLIYSFKFIQELLLASPSAAVTGSPVFGL